jgi:hypothetical protein
VSEWLYLGLRCENYIAEHLEGVVENCHKQVCTLLIFSVWTPPTLPYHTLNACTRAEDTTTNNFSWEDSSANFRLDVYRLIDRVDLDLKLLRAIRNFSTAILLPLYLKDGGTERAVASWANWD